MQKVNFWPTNGFNPFTGYGKMERGAYHALRDAGLEVDILPRDNGKEGISLVFASAKWAEVHGIESKRVWLWSMNESTKPAPEWVEYANRCERVLLPAYSLISYWRSAGVRVPMHYLPLGVDVFPIEAKKRVVKEGEPFTFLTYSLGDMRKGGELAMMAFKRCFGGNPKYRLIVKARDNYEKTWLAGLQDEQIEIVGGYQSEKEWRELLYRAHAFVFPSRGEGFGMPPREAVLSGLPTIATAWLGMEDAPFWAFPLSVAEFRPVQFDTFDDNAEGSLWAEPSKDDLDWAMRWIANDYHSAQAMALTHREYLLKHFSWQTVGAMFRELVVKHGN